MDRITGDYVDVVGGKRRFRNRNLSAGQRGTIHNAEYHNPLQEELVGGLIERAGLTPDAGDWSQVWQALKKLLGNRAYAEYTAAAAFSATIPVDDTIPQVTEGTQILSATLVPTSTTSILRVRFVGAAAVDSTGSLGWVAAAFVNGAADAACASFVTVGANQLHVTINALEFEYAPGSTAPQTISVRVGAQTGNIRLNGTAFGRLGGGSARASLTVEELPV